MNARPQTIEVDLQILTGCELHVHGGGCLFPEDLLALGRDHYEQVDWNHYIDFYEEVYGSRPDPIALFQRTLNGDATALEQFRQEVVVGSADSGDFSRFQAKYNFGVCLMKHWEHKLDRRGEIVLRSAETHRREGLDYVEYRSMFMNLQEDQEGFFRFHGRNAEILQSASGSDFTARYLISIPRWAPLEGYDLVQQLLDQMPELVPTIIGLDFCFFEEGYPPKTVQPLFERLQKDNQERPERALEVAYHVGEAFFDKSLESAVRWCHEVAEMGAKRLGHAIALGLDPAVAVARRPKAHEAEPVNERLDQIAYDLAHQEALAAYGVAVDVVALETEREALAQRPDDELVTRPYTPEQLAAVRRRQDFVLNRLAELGTVIETCPTSNLRIGGVPSPAEHPVHRFLRSDVNLVISADDPGTFNAPLAAEVEWVLTHSGYDPASLVERLGDPRRFRFHRKGV
jgi:adenosine deaminase